MESILLIIFIDYFLFNFNLQFTIGILLPVDRTDSSLHFVGTEDGKLVLPGNEEDRLRLS